MSPRVPRASAFLAAALAALVAAACRQDPPAPPPAGAGGSVIRVLDDDRGGGATPDREATAADEEAAAAQGGEPTPPEHDLRYLYNHVGSDCPVVEAYGVMARDPVTGDLGVALLASAPACGAMCIAARADVGIVATGANVESASLDAVLDRMAAGAAADQAVRSVQEGLHASSADRLFVAALDAQGRGAGHVGAFVPGHGLNSMIEAHKDWVAFSASVNTNAVVAVLQSAYPETAGLPLPERLILTLQKVRDEFPFKMGRRGDFRSKAVSSAILVVRRGGGRGSDRLVDVRCDFDADPMAALRGLYSAWSQAYLGPALLRLQRQLPDPDSPAYRANGEWMRRLRMRYTIGQRD